jgi:hypothetical protein
MEKIFVYNFAGMAGIPAYVTESASHIDGDIVYSPRPLKNYRPCGTTTADALKAFRKDQALCEMRAEVAAEKAMGA